MPRRWDLICFDWGGTLMHDRGPADLPMANWPEVRRVDGALEVLARLHAEGQRVCVATNASASNKVQVRKALERGGLLRFVEDVYCRTDIGFYKGDPQFWSIVQYRAHVNDLSRVAMIGDSLEQDVLAPLRCGLGLGVWFQPSAVAGSAASADAMRDMPPLPERARRVHSLLDVLPLLSD
ncbi:hypothetical protein SDC9_141059 [bioreactor metagenome]|uniref:Phosphoglycolate phosphatase n=1 Tax=bioreactor metagenome TaxID=1076179 RepID=A0A645DX13_9ZZZZ